jgi:hypothetical protein
MKKVMNRGLMVGMIVWLLTITCNLPNAVPQVSAEPTLSAEDLAATAVSIALTAQAGSNTAQPTPPPAPQPTQSSAPPTPEPSPTQCYALVTANTNANVRNGPGTAYDAVGYLPIGGTARVAGQNDARTWWYIEFAGGPGGYAWIAGSVTTSACIPAVLQVVAAPPLPTAVPATATNIPPVVVLPDLYVSEYSWSPVPPHMGVSFHVRVGVYNQGNGPAGAFTVQWWLSTSAPSATCTWNMASLVAHGGRILECDYTPGGWANYPSRVVVDSADTVGESNEANNTWSQTLQISP